MTNSSNKGDRGERELTNFMDDNGWAVIRVPASGSATKRDLPDLLLGKAGVPVAVEVKTVGGDKVYLDTGEVRALQSFSSEFGANPRVAVKFDLSHGDPAYGEDRPGFYFFEIGDLPRTDGGRWRVSKELAYTKGVPEYKL